MSRILKCFFITLLFAFIGNTFAFDTSNTHAYTASWISNKGVKASTPDIAKIVEVAFEQGVKHRIDPYLILALISKESTFNKKARNKSKASGLMQVIPYWHRDKIDGRNIFAVNVNIEVGTKILKDCLDKYSQNLQKGLRCYSGGAGHKYMKEIMVTRSKLRNWVVEQQFQSNQPVYYASSSPNIIF